MQIKIFEPETDEILTREDVANMKLPFDQGWLTYLVTDDVGNIEGTYSNLKDAEDHTQLVAA
ncbi:MAG: hypothetical protein K5863_09205 [Nitratireductor sp.]|uniref:hypothetical protein n=1 Tax=Nitratireductor sp. TaxID=1872084 RepID=UPI0026272C69|nr:hypothetical protein [Nitratireductor sp.]MCV0350242.1 hypothetical protein [Nitratireductor sp.]